MNLTQEETRDIVQGLLFASSVSISMPGCDKLQDRLFKLSSKLVTLLDESHKHLPDITYSDAGKEDDPFNEEILKIFKIDVE